MTWDVWKEELKLNFVPRPAVNNVTRLPIKDTAVEILKQHLERQRNQQSAFDPVAAAAEEQDGTSAVDVTATEHLLAAVADGVSQDADNQLNSCQENQSTNDSADEQEWTAETLNTEDYEMTCMAAHNKDARSARIALNKLATLTWAAMIIQHHVRQWQQRMAQRRAQEQRHLEEAEARRAEEEEEAARQQQQACEKQQKEILKAVAQAQQAAKFIQSAQCSYAKQRARMAAQSGGGAPASYGPTPLALDPQSVLDTLGSQVLARAQELGVDAEAIVSHALTQHAAAERAAIHRKRAVSKSPTRSGPRSTSCAEAAPEGALQGVEPPQAAAVASPEAPPDAKWLDTLLYNVPAKPARPRGASAARARPPMRHSDSDASPAARKEVVPCQPPAPPPPPKPLHYGGIAWFPDPPVPSHDSDDEDEWPNPPDGYHMVAGYWLSPRPATATVGSPEAGCRYVSPVEGRGLGPAPQAQPEQEDDAPHSPSAMAHADCKGRPTTAAGDGHPAHLRGLLMPPAEATPPAASSLAGLASPRPCTSPPPLLAVRLSTDKASADSSEPSPSAPLSPSPPVSPSVDFESRLMALLDSALLGSAPMNPVGGRMLTAHGSISVHTVHPHQTNAASQLLEGKRLLPTQHGPLLVSHLPVASPAARAEKSPRFFRLHSGIQEAAQDPGSRVGGQLETTRQAVPGAVGVGRAAALEQHASFKGQTSSARNRELLQSMPELHIGMPQGKAASCRPSTAPAPLRAVPSQPSTAAAPRHIGASPPSTGPADNPTPQQRPVSRRLSAPGQSSKPALLPMASSRRVSLPGPTTHQSAELDVAKPSLAPQLPAVSICTLPSLPSPDPAPPHPTPTIPNLVHKEGGGQAGPLDLPTSAVRGLLSQVAMLSSVLQPQPHVVPLPAADERHNSCKFPLTSISEEAPNANPNRRPVMRRGSAGSLSVDSHARSVRRRSSASSLTMTDTSHSQTLCRYSSAAVLPADPLP